MLERKWRKVPWVLLHWQMRGQIEIRMKDPTPYLHPAPYLPFGTVPFLVLALAFLKINRKSLVSRSSGVECCPFTVVVFLSLHPRLKMKPDVILRHLSIAVAATDQSYMPQQVTVAIGRTASNLQEVRDVHIPSNVTGYVTLLENANISQMCESITIQLVLFFLLLRKI